MSDRVIANATHRAAQSADIVNDPYERGRRRIVIDGETFPYFTQGPLETHPGQHGVGTVVMIPVWVDGPVTATQAPEPDPDDD